MKKDKRKRNEHLIETQLKFVDTTLKDGVFTFTSPMTISTFSHKIGKSANEIVGYFFKKGLSFNINHLLNEEQIAELCLELGYDFKKENEVNAQNFMDKIQIQDDSKELFARPPIITIMGHVDHGKTTLIDKIRNTQIVTSEAGGITQHIGAYQIEYKKNKITFLDTPGHEAFTQMRSRGAKLTDIVVLVVAADDGVKPQTKEAIVHSQTAKVPIIVFVNKMDKVSVLPEKILSELSDANLVVEKWGGDVQLVEGSALANKGIDKLFEAINIQAEILELKSNPNRFPVGVIIESRVDKGRGVVATAIVQNGTLHARDFIVAGSHYGRIRTMHSVEGKKLQEADASMPIIITGLNYSPKAGDKFLGFQNEKYAKSLANSKLHMDKSQTLKERKTLKVEEGVSIYNIIIKADVEGSAEAIKDSLLLVKNQEVKINIIATSIGAITRSDILLADASDALVIVFNTKITSEIKLLAKEKNVSVRFYTVIYKIIEDVKMELQKKEVPKFEEKLVGQAQIQKVIFYSKVGNIAGCMMESGEVDSDCLVKLKRNDKIIYEGELDSLQRGKDSVKKVEKGKDFGCHLKNYNEIEVGDIIEIYKKVEIPKDVLN